MKLGILVNSDRHLEAVAGLTKAALSKGHEVTIFTMDEGVRLLHEPVFRELCGMDRIKMSFCDHSTRMLEVPKEGLTDEIVCGSQYNNAVMNHEADKVIVL